jgi:hypothetical protein
VKVCTKCFQSPALAGKSHCESCKDKPRRKQQTRKERDAIYASIGMVRVKGAMGGTYYE